MQDRVGQQLGNYRLLRLLGRGGFANVYLGEHVYLKSHAALKLLHTQLTDEETHQFVREAQTLAGLAHPHIVRILDFAVQEGTPFLVIEYAPFGTLRTLHPKDTRLPLSLVASYIRQVAEALQYAHDRHLIHRDVKPENMLLGSHADVLLSDFGLAMLSPQVQPYSTQAIVQAPAGTSTYMAPEQVQGKAQPASDQYALGVIVYEWLCGTPPFKGTPLEVVMQHLSAPPPPLREVLSDLPASIEAVIMRSLAKEPELRFACVQDFALALQRAYQELDTPTPGQFPVKSSPDASVVGTALPASHNTQRDPPTPLLATKLHIPRPRSELVSRSHLLERLQKGAKQPLTLLSAPAGFGKTTLLAQWYAESALPVAWLSLEPEDNDPTRFLSYLIAALQTLHPQLGSLARALLEAPQYVPAERVLALLVNEIVESSTGDFALVLDDYHIITAEPIHRALLFLLDHLPSQLHLVVATRADPLLPLARLRARGQLTEIRAADLRFVASEVDTFLQEVMGLDLSPEATTTLETRTEGWVAGLQLAALALQGRADVSGFLAAFRGSHRFILDYLSEEVLSRLDAQVEAFLLRTALLERLSGPLCDAVTGQPGSQATLEGLEKANLFVVSLDDERRWYRYHHLFAEVLRSHLLETQPQLVPELHRRASTWYLEHGFVVEAVQHALAAPDFEHAARLLEEHAQAVAMAGQVHLVLGWLHALPDTLMRTRPILCIDHADLLMHTQQLEAAEARLQDAEHCLAPDTPPDQARIIRGCVADIRAIIARRSGDLSRFLALAQRALELLPESEELWRASAGMNAAHSYLLSGDVTPAIEHLVRAAIALSLPSGDIFQVLLSGRLLARLQVLQGQLREAAVTYEKAGQTIPNQKVLRVLGSASVHSFGMGDLLREWNKLDAAEDLLADGMELLKGTLSISADEVMHGYIALARLKQARGAYSQALATLEAFRQLARQRHYVPQLLAQGAAVQAQIELARGNLAEAVRWAETSGLSSDNTELPYLREREYLTMVRVRIAQGRENSAVPFLQDALHLLDRLLEDAEAKARMSSTLEILILRALALHAQRELADALVTLRHALTLAEPEGYIRLFVDEGAPMLSLLRQAQSHGIVPDYVASLISAFGEQTKAASSPQTSSSVALLEPLTEREREVLQLIVAGASNREIAHRLIVSLGTVKKHVSNICGKLGVQSRTQAIARARALRLL
jgi:LuxR family maltose regulon positive regulatory protein